MYSYEELEKIYYQRKIKSALTFVGIFLLFAIGTIILLIPNKEKEKIITDKEKKLTTKKPYKPTIHKENTQKPLILHFILPKIEENTTISKTTKKEINKTNSLSKQTKKPLIIISQKVVDIKDLIKSYNQFPSYNKAVEIANLYLQKNNLKKAQEWALKANNIDASDYKSWIIFAKILIKQNKHKQAIKVLNTYIENYGTNEAIEKLIKEIQ